MIFTRAKLISSSLLLCLLPVMAAAQDGLHVNRHKFYDTTRVEDFQKIKRRRLTADVDSTGIALYAWGNECYLKINLLDRMLINVNFYEQGTRNGRPYIKYGNNRYRFRMYINKGGNFEFDAIIRSRSANGRYRIPFNIDTKGLRITYQPELTAEEIAMNAVRPDSVVGSYSIYRIAGGNNHIDPSTGAGVYYGTGKMGHLYRPRAWDAAGDTVWGFVEFNKALTRMAIGVDSTWMANAVYPVTIDPTLGKTASGASATAINDYEHNIQYNFTATPGAGTITTAHAYTYVTSGGSTEEWVVHVYTDPDAGDCTTTDFLATSSTRTVTNTNTDTLLNIGMSGTLAAATAYVVVWQGHTSDGRLRYRYDAAGFAEECELADTDLVGPSDMTGCGCASSQDHSTYITYTADGAAADISYVRRIKEGEGK